MKTIYNITCMLFLIPFCLRGQTSEMKQYFNELERLEQHNGNMLLAEDGQVLINFSSGFSDFASHRENKAGSHFNLASISKIFTATAILQLRDQGKFQLDEPVYQYLKAFPFQDITIRQLLTHTSGLPDLELFEDLVKRYPDTVITNKNIIPELSLWHKGLYFKPGDQFQYCNTEYNVLALLIEITSHLSFEDYIRKNIFQPAGMTDAYFSTSPIQVDALEAIPQMKPHPGYDSTFVPTDSIKRFKYLTYNNSGTLGHSNINCTTEDLLRFDQAYFKGSLLKRNTMEEAMTPIKLNNGNTYYAGNMDTMAGEGKMSYGLGWEIFEQPDFGKSLGHGGFKFGLATFYFHNLQRHQTIIAFDNTAGSEFGRFISSSLNLMNGLTPMVFRTSKSLVSRYGTALVKSGPDHAAAVFNTFKADRVNFYLNEGEMNDLGYDLFYGSTFKGHQELALEAFKLATFIFPNSFNTYDSYGQLLRDMGNKEDAILMYQKSIALNPNNTDGIRILNELLEN